MNDDRDRRVRDRAYALWEQEGRPHGRHEEHWHQAEQEAGIHEAMAPGAGQVAAEGSPTAQPGAPGRGGVGSDAGGASAGSGGLGGIMGGDQAGHAGASAPGGAEALGRGQQRGATDPAAPELGSRGGPA